jgi:hypothetical protein
MVGTSRSKRDLRCRCCGSPLRPKKGQILVSNLAQTFFSYFHVKDPLKPTITHIYVTLMLEFLTLIPRNMFDLHWVIFGLHRVAYISHSLELYLILKEIYLTFIELHSTFIPRVGIFETFTIVVSLNLVRKWSTYNIDSRRVTWSWWGWCPRHGTCSSHFTAFTRDRFYKTP